MNDLKQIPGGGSVQFTIKVIAANGQEKLLSDHAGVMVFTTREHAERMTHRLAACDDSGDLFEVIEQPK